MLSIKVDCVVIEAALNTVAFSVCITAYIISIASSCLSSADVKPIALYAGDNVGLLLVYHTTTWHKNYCT